MNAEIEKIPNIDLAVWPDSLQEDQFAVYSQLFPGVAKDELTFEELPGGYVNSIWKLTRKDSKDKTVIFRTFDIKLDGDELNKHFSFDSNKNKEDKENAKGGDLNGDTNSDPNIKPKLANGDAKKSDQPTESEFSQMLFNRLSEYKVMHVVSKHGLCQPVYATYKNGIVYGFTEGNTLNGPLMLTNDFLNEAASKLARFHSIDYEVPGAKFEDHFLRMEYGMRTAFQENFEEMGKQIAAIDEAPYNEMPKMQLLFEWEKKLLEILKELGLGKLVLCHNDANQKNLIWNSQKRTLGFIDFEMTLKNYPALDIGYLIGCYTGHFLCDFNEAFYPNENYRREFCRQYLRTYHTLTNAKPTKEQFELELEELYHKVNIASLMNLLRWAMYSSFFDFHPEMFKDNELKKNRLQDKYFNVKYALSIYRFVLPTSEKYLKEARDYLEKRKQAQNGTKL